MKKKIIYVMSALALVSGFAACKKDPVVGGTATQSLAGEWWIKLDGGKGEFGNKYYSLNTYNTAANRADSLWFDDGNSFWDVKGKVACNAAGQTFGSPKPVTNVSYESFFTITEGRVLTNAAHAPGSGDKTDSITFKIQFSDESPSATHIATGYKRTGFQQDDH